MSELDQAQRASNLVRSLPMRTRSRTTQAANLHQRQRGHLAFPLFSRPKRGSNIVLSPSLAEERDKRDEKAQDDQTRNPEGWDRVPRISRQSEVQLRQRRRSTGQTWRWKVPSLRTARRTTTGWNGPSDLTAWGSHCRSCSPAALGRGGGA
jgi:hypothetical protein